MAVFSMGALSPPHDKISQKSPCRIGLKKVIENVIEDMDEKDEKSNVY